jgi:hypothetical protein
MTDMNPKLLSFLLIGLLILAYLLPPALEWARDHIERRFSHRSAVARIGVLVMSILIVVAYYFPIVIAILIVAFGWLLHDMI